MPFGWANPFPMQLGSGSTPVEQAYEAVRRAHGRGPQGSDAIGPRDGLRDLWTQVECIAVAASQSCVEHAFWQAFPTTMTDHLPVWEHLLMVPMAATLVARQRAVTLVYTRIPDATIPALRVALQEISPNLGIEFVPDAETIVSMAGKEFGPLPGATGQAFGTGLWAARQSSAWPNYSDDFVLRVRYALTGSETQIPYSVVTEVDDLLQDVLPGWADYLLYTLTIGPDGDGFYFDGGLDGTSRLDVTGMTP